jgi:hypothetical protein
LGIIYRVIVTDENNQKVITFYSDRKKNQGEGYNALRTKNQKENVPLDNNDSIIVNGLVIPYADTVVKAIVKDRSILPQKVKTKIYYFIILHLIFISSS